MPRNWIPTPLGKVVSLQRGFDLAKEARIPGPFRILSAGKSGETHNEAKAKGPGFAIGRATNLGKPQWSDEDFWPLNTTLFATDFHGNDPRWLFYWFENADLTGFDSGSVQPMLNRNYIASISINLPPIEEQTAIATMLRSLDDKISTNVRIINATESLVDVLYSRVIKTPTEQSFAEVAQVFGGSTPSTKNDAFWDGDINWATPTDITALDGPWIGDTSRKITKAGLASMSSSLHPENSILMTSRATIGAIALASGPIATNQGFIVVEAPDELTPWLFAQMKARKHEFEAWANGATFMELSRGNFKKLPFIGCSDDDLQAFNDAAWPLLKRAQAAQKENQVLARTRDELLPLLMSGRITVGEAEEAADVAGSAASES